MQSLANPVIDKIASLITILGEMPIPALIALFILWCIDKRKGYVILSTLLSATCLMQIIKAIFRVPRPFMAFPEEVKGKRVSTSTGYSFPSGHSTTASSFYGALYKLYNNKAVRVITLLIIILVPISRIYLGAHWPLDVIVGTIIGLLSAFVLSNFLLKIYESDRAFYIFNITFAAVAALIAIVLSILIDTTDIDYRATQNLAFNTALAAGIFAGFALERKYVGYLPPLKISKKLIVFLLGLVGAAAICILLSLIPTAMKETKNCLLYIVVGLYATYIYPLIIVKLKLAQVE